MRDDSIPRWLGVGVQFFAYYAETDDQGKPYKGNLDHAYELIQKPELGKSKWLIRHSYEDTVPECDREFCKEHGMLVCPAWFRNRILEKITRYN